MSLQASSRQCASAWAPSGGSGSDGRYMRWIITFLEREKMCLRVVLNSREGVGLTCMGPEVSDCLDCPGLVDSMAQQFSGIVSG
jgi:hypothetical protein